jgi:hypothetical protein
MRKHSFSALHSASAWLETLLGLSAHDSLGRATLTNGSQKAYLGMNPKRIGAGDGRLRMAAEAGPSAI